MFLILCGTLLSASVLVLRQQRLQAISDMTKALARAAVHDRTLWHVRTEIAEGISPEHVMEMASAVGPLRTIPREVCPPGPTYAEGKGPKPSVAQAIQQRSRP